MKAYCQRYAVTECHLFHVFISTERYYEAFFFFFPGKMLVPIKSLLKKTSRRTNFYMPQKKRNSWEQTSCYCFRLFSCRSCNYLCVNNLITEFAMNTEWHPFTEDSQEEREVITRVTQCQRQVAVFWTARSCTDVFPYCYRYLLIKQCWKKRKS